VQAKELLQKMKTNNPPILVDVRTLLEFRAGHIPGAIHAPMAKILLRLADLPKDRSAELVLTCEHGPRAKMAQGLLGMLGFQNTVLLEGHMAGWRSAGLETEK